MNETWRPKIERWKSAIEDYLDLWQMSDADIDTVLLRCQNDPILRFEYLRLKASIAVGFGRASAESVSYELVYVDPPWSYRDSANAGKRGAQGS